MFQEEIPWLWIYPGNLTKIIKSLVFIISCGSIEPCLFVAYFSTMFPTTVSSVQPTFQRNGFLHNMDNIRIIIRKDICWIRRGVKSTNIIFRVNRDGIWEQIWGISGYFIRGGSIINGDGRKMHIRAAIISCKGIIESVINRPVVVPQCWNFSVHISLWNTMTVQELPICNTHTQCHCSCKSKISTLCYPIFI